MKKRIMSTSSDDMEQAGESQIVQYILLDRVDHLHVGDNHYHASVSESGKIGHYSTAAESVKLAIRQIAKERCGEVLIPVYKCVGDIRPPMYVETKLGNLARPASAPRLEDVFSEAERNAEGESGKYSSTEEAKRGFIHKHKNVVMLIGPAGIGKTTGIKHFGIKTLEGKVLPDVKWVFYIDCKQIDLKKKWNLFHFLLVESGCESECQLPSDIGSEALRAVIGTTGAGCLIMLDGLEEIGSNQFDAVRNCRYNFGDDYTAAEHIFCLLTGRFLKNAKKLCTIRRTTAATLLQRIQFPTVLGLLGLNHEDQNKIGQAMCGEMWKKFESRLNENADLREICNVPFVCVIVMHCMKLSLGHEPGAANLRTVTGILIYAIQCCVNKLHENASHRGSFFNDLDKLGCFAWLKVTNKNPSFDDADVSDGVKSIFMRSEENKIGFRRKVDFYHILWQHFFAALHAMTKISVSDFRQLFKLSNLMNADKEPFTCFLFGLCNKKNLELSSYTNSFPNTDDTWEKKKQFLRDQAIEAVKLAGDKGHDYERNHILFQLGRWLKEKKDDDLLHEIESHVPTTVTLTGKIYPSDVNALMHLLKPDRTKRQVEVGTMRSPLFQGNSLPILFHSVSRKRKLFMPSVDLRGNKVEDDVVEQISTCVNKIDHFNLRSTQITPKGIERIWKKIALREKPMKRVAVEDSITREKPMCESTLLAFRHATSRIIDLCLSIDDNSDQNLMKLAKAVRSNNSSIENLDIGVPCLTCRSAVELGKCLMAVKYFRLRGCSLEKQEEGAVCKLLSGLLQRKQQIACVFLDHVSVSGKDVELLSKCLPKIRDDLVVMYCGVDRNGFEMLKREYEDLSQPNSLRVFLGDVEGVGNSVSLQ